MRNILNSDLEILPSMPSDDEEYPSEPETQNTSFSTCLSIILITSKTIPPKSGSKAAPKVTKESKTKEMTFSINEDNYCDFMKACLSKHGEKRYKVTRRSTFSFKYLCLPGRKHIHIHLPMLHNTDRAPYPVNQTILMLMKRMITKIWSRRSLRGSRKS